MSFTALSWALQQDIERTSAKFLLIAIAHYASDHDAYGDESPHQCAWPRQRLLARDCSMSLSSVYANLKYLEGAGFIRTEKRTDRTGAQMSNMYILQVHSEKQGPPPQPTKGAPLSPPGGPPSAHQGPITESELPKEQESIPPYCPPADREPEIPVWRQAVRTWNEVVHAAGGQKCLEGHMRGARLGKLRTALKDGFENDLSEWERYCRQVAANDWWCGRAPDSRYTGKKMRISIDLSVRPDIVERIKNDHGFRENKSGETLSQRFGGL